MTRRLAVSVETTGGVLFREIEAASPLREDVERGAAAEEATDEAAALWGLPDFLFRAELLPLGSGTREIGDRLLIVGGLGAVVQVKSREGPVGDDAKERRWIEKKLAHGLRQAHGTIRKLKTGPVRLTNARGRVFDVDGRELHFLAVVVIDHDAAPDAVTPAVADEPNPSVVILRRDWEFLFDQLRSTYAVLRYFERVAADKPVELGDEPLRYYNLAVEDDATPPGSLDSRLLRPHAQRMSIPMLPVRHPELHDDLRPQLLVRLIFEDVASIPAASIDEQARLRLLATLDRLPVSLRDGVGRFLIDAMEENAKPTVGHSQWRQRRIVSDAEGNDPPLQLAYAACSLPHDDVVQEMFGSLVQLRHHDLYQVFQRDDLMTIGLLLTPRSNGRQWDTTLVATGGDPKLDADLLELLRQTWPEPEAV